MDGISVGVNVVMIICQIVVIVLASLAVGGGTWIEDVENSGDYFVRIQSGYTNQQTLSINGDLHSMGMWRMFSEPGVSDPLPIRDPELTAGTLCYIGALTLGCFSIVLLSYQILGVRPKCIVFSLTVFWACFIEFVLLLVATTVVLHYFKNTFRYESLGHSHHVSWVSFSFSSLTTIIAIVKLYLCTTDAEVTDPKYKYRNPNNPMTLNGSNNRPVSPKSVNSAMMAAAAPYHRDSYPGDYARGGGPPHGDYRYNDSYEMRPAPPKNYAPA